MSEDQAREFSARFGNRLRECRVLRHGHTLRELAGKAGLSVGFLSDVENGKRCVSLANAVTLAGALGVPLSDLLPGG